MVSDSVLQHSTESQIVITLSYFVFLEKKQTDRIGEKNQRLVYNLMKATYPTSTVLLLGDPVILLLMIPNLCGRAARPYGYYQTCCHPSMMIVCVTHADL